MPSNVFRTDWNLDSKILGEISFSPNRMKMLTGYNNKFTEKSINLYSKFNRAYCNYKNISFHSSYIQNQQIVFYLYIFFIFTLLDWKTKDKDQSRSICYLERIWVEKLSDLSWIVKERKWDCGGCVCDKRTLLMILLWDLLRECHYNRIILDGITHITSLAFTLCPLVVDITSWLGWDWGSKSISNIDDV